MVKIMHNPFAWIEIPVDDMARAVRFYETVFQIKLNEVSFGGLQMAWFPNAGSDAPGATGTLIKQESYVPSKKGPFVYFYSENGQDELDRLAEAGGALLRPKTQISPEYGYMAVFIDSEGNRIALYSAQ